MSKRRRRTLVLTAICVSTVGTGIAMNAWVVHHAAPHIISVDAAQHRAPKKAVVLVLGASVRANGQPSRVLVDRLATALQVAGTTRSVLVTGDGLTAREVNGMRQWLLARGLDKSRLIEDPAGLRTWDSMVRAKDVFQLDDVIVVTNAFHIARSVYLANAAGLRAVGVAAPPQASPPRWKNHARESIARVRAVVDVTLGLPATYPHGYGPGDGPTGSNQPSKTRSPRQES